MYNNLIINYEIGATMDNTNECTFTASNFRRDDFEKLAESLDALGIVFNYEISQSGKTAKVSASFPDKYDAKQARTRNAGRPSKGIRPPHDSIFNCDTTCVEFLEWQSSHTAEEGMEQLGLPRATYFRRLSKIRELVEWERVNNPQRIKRGMDELHHTLQSVS